MSSTFAILPSAFSRKTNTATPIMKLPNELLSEIARLIPGRHASLGYTTDCTSLSALSCVSRVMRAVALPHLFREVPITSERQLSALQAVPADLLHLVR